MRDLRYIRHYLDLDRAKLLATALVSSCPDYCNSLFMVLATLTSQAFTRVQNRLAHLVTKSPPFTHSVPLLHSLHLLSVRFRIIFKINLLTYKTLCEKQPVYLHSVLVASLPSHSLRQNKDNSLSVPRLDQLRHKGFSFLCSVSMEQAVCPFSHFRCYLQKTSEDTSL